MKLNPLLNLRSSNSGTLNSTGLLPACPVRNGSGNDVPVLHSFAESIKTSASHFMLVLIWQPCFFILNVFVYSMPCKEREIKNSQITSIVYYCSIVYSLNLQSLCGMKLTEQLNYSLNSRQQHVRLHCLKTQLRT